jgi:hypothetical protein
MLVSAVKVVVKEMLYTLRCCGVASAAAYAAQTFIGKGIDM